MSPVLRLPVSPSLHLSVSLPPSISLRSVHSCRRNSGDGLASSNAAQGPGVQQVVEPAVANDGTAVQSLLRLFRHARLGESRHAVVTGNGGARDVDGNAGARAFAKPHGQIKQRPLAKPGQQLRMGFFR